MNTEIMTSGSKNIDDDGTILERIKQNVQNSYEYLRQNFRTYAAARDFVFVSGSTEPERSFNAELMRPSIKVNVLEAMINKACGEFSKAQPSIKASATDDFMPSSDEEAQQNADMIDFLAGYCRHIEYKARKEGVQYNSFRETISGGMSALRVGTRYVNEHSFNQEPYIDNIFDMTMCGYDPLAQDPDKSDGDYIYEVFPKRLSDFMREYEGVDTSTLDFIGTENVTVGGQNVTGKDFGPFQWAYFSGDDKIVVIVDYYEKKRKKTKLYLLSDEKTVMTKEEYNEYLKTWNASGQVALPMIKIKERDTEIVTICRYQCIQNKILSYEEIDYPTFPIGYIGGNNVVIRDQNASGAARDVVKPYLMHCEGAQMLKNFAASSLANELENMRPPTIIASIDAVPEKYIDMYRRPQNSGVLPYNQYKDGNANFRLDTPILAPRQPVPPELMNTIMMTDEMIQNITGNFDSSLTKMANQNISGVALETSLSMSNTALQPYIHNWLLSYESRLQLIIDIAPIYLAGERTIMTISPTGEEKQVTINKADGSGIQLTYKPGQYKIKVEAGLAFGIQQSQALNQVVAMSHAIPAFGEFVNSKCLDLIVGTLEIPHAEQYRVRAKAQMAETAAAKKIAMENAQTQPRIEQQAMQVAAQQVQAEHQVGMANVQVKRMDAEAKTALKVAELELDKQKHDVELERIRADLQIALAELEMTKEKHVDDRIIKMIDTSIKQSDHIHDKADKHYARTLDTLIAEREHQRAEKEFNHQVSEVKKEIE